MKCSYNGDMRKSDFLKVISKERSFSRNIVINGYISKKKTIFQVISKIKKDFSKVI